MIKFFKKLLKGNNMKFWICKDTEGTYLYCGQERPIYVEETGMFESVEDAKADYDWISSDTLSRMFIKYPKNLKVGECKRMIIDIKSKW